jgi:hypothetical protein
MCTGLLGIGLLLGQSGLVWGQAPGADVQIDQVSPVAPANALAGEVGLSEGQLLQTIAGPETGSLGYGLDGTLPRQGVRVLQFGVENSVTVNQQGSSNFAAVLQAGGYNVTDITQRGTSNAAGVLLGGFGNEVALLQEGEGNRYLLGYRGSGLDRRREQIGQNNRMIEVGRSSTPMRIQQRGTDMRLRIRHNSP